MRSTKIIACIMSIALTLSSLCCLSDQNGKVINTVSADSTDMEYTECTDIECTIKDPDFIISENEQLNTTDLKRHGIQIKRNFNIYHQPKQTILGQAIYREEFGRFAESSSLCDFDVQIPKKLVEGKNTIHIFNISYNYSANLECDLNINVIFSEDSEKKDLRKRSETMFGDIDMSSKTDIKDLVTLCQYLLWDITTLTAGQYMCSDVTGDDEVDICDLAMLRQYIMNDDVDLGRTKKPDEDILFIKVYLNYAWEFQYNGVIYDKEGNEYNFDLSDCNYYSKYLDRILLDKIRVVHRTSRCNETHKLNAENMTYINSLINKLDEDPQFNDPVDEACDFGQISFYAVKYNEDNTAKLIKVYSYGDNRFTPKDENAAELFRYYSEAAGISDSQLLIFE